MDEQNDGRCVAIVFFQQFYLDREKDIVVDLYMEGERMHYIMRTPNHRTGNLIRNLASLFDLAAAQDESGLLVIRGEVPCYFDGANRRMYILRLGGTKVANIYPDGRGLARCLVTLAVISLGLAFLAFLMMRRTRYDSL